MARYYETQARLRDLLAAGMASMPARVEEWQREVQENRISDELRQVLVALGWITSRDSRVTLIRDERPKQSEAAQKGR